jgi:homoserine kinase type II
MSVFTRVTEAELVAWLRAFDVGTLVEQRGILAGIENTNYFVTTTVGRYVLTLFEKLAPAELPFYLDLMGHLAHAGFPCPAPIGDRAGRTLHALNGKPAALVTRLDGEPVMAPAPPHCARVGDALARLHLASRGYAGHLDNLRGPHWWTTTAPVLMPFLDAGDRQLLADEVAFQASHRHDQLPRGVVHADLFRDNVLFAGDVIGGVIDFYFACVDVWLYDLAITVNDWCTHDDGTLDAARARALIDAYAALRPFDPAEHAAWPVMLRAGALRFWVSRLYDFHLPRPGDLVHAHDPGRFQRVLRAHVRGVDVPLRAAAAESRALGSAA